MADLPPPYSFIVNVDAHDRLPTEVKAQLDALCSLPPEVKEAATKAVEQELAKPETIQKVLEEVKNLRDSVVETDKLFEKVRRTLAEIDSRHCEIDGKRLPELERMWKGYQMRWTNILWESRDMAAVLVENIEEFLHNILPAIRRGRARVRFEFWMARAQRKLEGFVERKNPLDRDVGKKHSQTFTDLERDVEQFKDRFKDYMKPLRHDLGRQIKEKNDKITKLSDQIDKCEAAIIRLAKELGIIILVTGTGIAGTAIAFGSLAPIAIAGVLIAGAVAADVKVDEISTETKKVRGLQAEQDILKREVENLTKQLKDMQRVQTNLGNQKDTIFRVAARIDQFALIWSHLAFEARVLSRRLQRAYEDPHTAKELWERLEKLETNYTTLKTALVIYGTKANSSK